MLSTLILSEHSYSAIVSLSEAKKKGAEGVLFCDHNGYILEGGRENFFAIKQGTLITPKRGILQGITRQVVLEIAKSLCKIQVRDVHGTETPDFEAAFFTSTQKEIMPISQIDDVTLPAIHSCSLLRRIIASFKNYTQSYYMKREYAFSAGSHNN